jgi:hypothetical protein
MANTARYPLPAAPRERRPLRDPSRVTERSLRSPCRPTVERGPACSAHSASGSPAHRHTNLLVVALKFRLYLSHIIRDRYYQHRPPSARAARDRQFPPPSREDARWPRGKPVCGAGGACVSACAVAACGGDLVSTSERFPGDRTADVAGCAPGTGLEPARRVPGLLQVLGLRVPPAPPKNAELARRRAVLLVWDGDLARVGG